MLPRSLLMILLAGSAWAGGISGIVVESGSGNALPSADIKLQRAGASELVADLESDSNGRFELSNLPAGDYRVEVSKPNYTGATLRFRVADGMAYPSSLTARLVRCGVISGRVTDLQGQPVRGATVFAISHNGRYLRPYADLQAGHRAHVDDDGEFRLFDLPQGQFVVAVTYGASTVTVGSTGGAQLGAFGSGVLFYPSNAEPRIFTISGGDEYHDIDFSIAPGALYRVSGKIEAPASQSGFWLALTASDQPALATAVATAAPDGSFHFEGIPPGTYFLLVSGPSHARGGRGAVLGERPLFGRMQVEVGADVDDILIPVQSGRSAKFLLRGPAQQCPSSAPLLLSPLEDWAAELDRTVTINLTKPQRIDDLAPGRYFVSLKSKSCRANEEVIDLSASSDAPRVTVIQESPNKE